jgi:mannose-6-phosphate isomerase-like protein (cupin superfamily)
MAEEPVIERADALGHDAVEAPNLLKHRICGHSLTLVRELRIVKAYDLGMGTQDYDIRLDDKYGSLTLIDIPAELAAHEPWFNQTLTTVNDAVVRLGILEGEFHWHKHDDQDEFFLVLDGELLIDLEDRETVALRRHQGYTVPRGVVHRTRAPERTAVVMVEAAGVAPTGD